MITVTGTDGDDRITVNDAEGVVIASPGVKVGGVVKGPTTLAANDARGPHSEKGDLMWTFDGKGNNHFKGDFGAGNDRYYRIDGPGNDRYEYEAGPGDDVVTSTDGPGNDEYLYNNGPGNDFSVHANNGLNAGGNDLYRINGGPGVDRTALEGDGPGDDVYEFLNAETISISDYHRGDDDKVAVTRDSKDY